MRPALAYVYNVLVWADEGLNVLTGGDSHETLSSRLGKMHRGDYGTFWQRATRPLHWLVNTIALILFGQKDHCEISLQNREGLEDLFPHDTAGEES